MAFPDELSSESDRVQQNGIEIRNMNHQDMDMVLEKANINKNANSNVEQSSEEKKGKDRPNVCFDSNKSHDVGDNRNSNRSNQPSFGRVGDTEIERVEEGTDKIPEGDNIIKFTESPRSSISTAHLQEKKEALKLKLKKKK